MSWSIDIAYRDRSAAVHEIGSDARHLEDPEDAAVVRQLTIDAMVDTDCQTVGTRIDGRRPHGARRRCAHDGCATQVMSGVTYCLADSRRTRAAADDA
jgi:hypothetical protein